MLGSSPQVTSVGSAVLSSTVQSGTWSGMTHGARASDCAVLGWLTGRLLSASTDGCGWLDAAGVWLLGSCTLCERRLP